MKVILDRILDGTRDYMRTYGNKPSHLIVSIDIWYQLKTENNPIDGILVPAEYSKDMLFDTIYGLKISILSNHNGTTDYLKVL